jgi:restriction system protein
MPEVGRRREGELERGVFKILLDQPEGLPAREILQRMEEVVPLTEFERSDYPNHPGVPRFKTMVRFLTIGPVKAVWMIKDRGKWRLTDEGKSAYLKHQDPLEFRNEVSRLFRQVVGKRPEDASEPDEKVQEESTAIQEAPDASSTLEEAEETAWSEIERHVQVMNPYDLQRLVAALLRAMGYHVSWTSPPGPDRGIDILAHNDPLGTSTPRIKVQVKRRADRISVDGLRSFMAILGEQDVGIFVSTGSFTGDAESEARTKETRKLTLLDLEKLFDLWVEHYDKVSESDKRLLPLKPVYYLALGE